MRYAKLHQLENEKRVDVFVSDEFFLIQKPFLKENKVNLGANGKLKGKNRYI